MWTCRPDRQSKANASSATRVQNGIVFFTSYVPGTAICGSGGGVNWLYGLNLLTGGGQMSGLSPTIGGEALCTGNCGGVALTKKGDLSQRRQ